MPRRVLAGIVAILLAFLLAPAALGTPLVATPDGFLLGVLHQGDLDRGRDAPVRLGDICLFTVGEVSLTLQLLTWSPEDVATLVVDNTAQGHLRQPTSGTPPTAALRFTAWDESCPVFAVEGTHVASQAVYRVQRDA